MTDDNQNTGSQTPSEKELFLGAQGIGPDVKPFNGIQNNVPMEEEIDDYADLEGEYRERYKKWMEMCHQLGLNGSRNKNIVKYMNTCGMKGNQFVLNLQDDLGCLVDEGDKVSFEGETFTPEAAEVLATQILAHGWESIKLNGTDEQKIMIARAIYEQDPNAKITNVPEKLLNEMQQQSAPSKSVQTFHADVKNGATIVKPEYGGNPNEVAMNPVPVGHEEEKPTIEEVESKHSRQKIEKRPDGVIVPSGDAHIYAGDILNKDFKGMEGRLSEIARSSKDREIKRHANELLEKVYKDMELGDYLKNKKKYSTALNDLHEGLLANGGNDAEIKTVLSGANETLDELRGKKPLVIEQLANIPKSKKTGLGPKGEEAAKRVGVQYNQMKS